MIDAILFDLGDTLIDFGMGRAEAEGLFRRGARITYDHLRARGTPVGEFDRYFKAHYSCMKRAFLWSKVVRRDFSYAAVLRKVARQMKLGIPDHEIHDLAWLWYQPILKDSRTDAGIREMLTAFRHAGTRLAVVSNTIVPGHCLDRHLEHVHLLEFFPVRIYSSDVRYRKPHRRIFEIALKQLGAAPQRSLFVGDLLQTDILGAKRLGMKTVWKPAGHVKSHQSPSAHRYQPDFTIRRITELPAIISQLRRHPAPSPASPLVETAA